MSPDEKKQVEESISLAEAIARRRALDEAERICRDEAGRLERQTRSEPTPSVAIAYRAGRNAANYCADAIAALREKP